VRTPRSPTDGPETTIPVQAKLAALWASLMFLYLYVDLLSLYQPGVIDGILDGRVWELDITQTWAVGALALMAIPIAMVSLSLTLPARVNRLTNLIVATLYVAVSIANAVGETWTYYFILAVGLELAVLVSVLRYAWAWPAGRPSPRTVPQADTARQPADH
jgi:Na+-transporting methylmalonyl-CoA/oxaloacetate decarboxylase beta subunit